MRNETPDMQLEEQIQDYLISNLLYVEDDYEYDRDTSFIGDGLIDSMGVTELVTYVESAFGITVEQEDVTPDNFDSINKLAAFIRRSQASQAACQRADDVSARETATNQLAPSR